MNSYKKRNINWVTINIVVAILLVKFLSIGFSALETILEINDINAVVRIEEDARVIGVQQVSITNSANILNYDYNTDNIYGKIKLPNGNSQATFAVTIANIGNVELGFSEVTLSDTRLDYEIVGYTEGTKLCDNNNPTTCKLGSQSTFNISIKYKNGATITNDDINFTATFNLRHFHNISYLNISNTTNYPKEIMEGETLIVRFTNDVPQRIKVKRSDNTPLQTNEYTYTQDPNNSSNKILTVPNIDDDLIIDRDYTITYILNGGINDSTNPDSYALSDTITLKNPTYTGNRFQGWYQNSGFTGQVVTSTTQLSGDVTLYAKWIPEYSITYFLYNGTNNNDNPNSYISTDTIAIQDPIRTNYIFVGWYLNSTYTGSIITNTSQLSGNTELHAKWVPIFNITYTLNGGTNPNNQITEFSELASLNILNATHPHDATFDGWYQNSGLTGTRINTTSQLNSNTTLYAKWTSSIANMNFDATTNRFNSTNVSGVTTARINRTDYQYTQNIVLIQLLIQLIYQ